MGTLVSVPTEGEIVEARERARAIAVELKRAARRSRQPVSIVSGGGGFQARRGDRWFIRGLIISFVMIVALPILSVSIYMGFIAADQYSTETRLSLRAGESSILDSFAGMAGLGTSQQYQDALLIADYIRSRGMVEQLERQISLREIFSRREADVLFGFSPKKPIEDLVKYWRGRVDTSLDSVSGVIMVNVRAFRPEDSLLIANKIVEVSERLVNEVSRRVRDDALRNAETELRRADAARRKALLNMQEARNSQGVLDGTIAATALENTIMALNLQLSKLEEQAAVQSSSISRDSPAARILTSRINSLKGQIQNYRDRLAGNSGGRDSLATRMNLLDERKKDLEILEKQYAASLVSYETARLEAETQKAYLVPFIAPTLAEKALYPRRWWEWSIVTIPALLLWSIGAGLAYLIRDYRAA